MVDNESDADGPDEADRGPGGRNENSSDASRVDDVAVAIAVVQSMSHLARGRADIFLETETPPDDLVLWLQGATLPQVNGLLIQTLRRWHECRLGWE